MNELQTMVHGKTKIMAEAAAAFAIGGAVIGLLFDKIGAGSSDNYAATKTGALVGSLVGAGIGASRPDVSK